MKKPFEHFEVKEGKTDWVKEFDRQFGNVYDISVVLTPRQKRLVEEFIKLLLSHQRQEILDQAISILWKSHRDEPEPEDEDAFNPGLDLAIQKLSALRGGNK